MIALVSCFSSPFSPAMSAGVLHPASNSSIKSFDFFIRSPCISEDRLHKMIYTLLLGGSPHSNNHPVPWNRSSPHSDAFLFCHPSDCPFFQQPPFLHNNP